MVSCEIMVTNIDCNSTSEVEVIANWKTVGCNMIMGDFHWPARVATYNSEVL